MVLSDPFILQHLYVFTLPCTHALTHSPTFTEPHSWVHSPTTGARQAPTMAIWTGSPNCCLQYPQSSPRGGNRPSIWRDKWWRVEKKSECLICCFVCVCFPNLPLTILLKPEALFPVENPFYVVGERWASTFDPLITKLFKCGCIHLRDTTKAPPWHLAHRP